LQQAAQLGALVALASSCESVCQFAHSFAPVYFVV